MKNDFNFEQDKYVKDEKIHSKTQADSDNEESWKGEWSEAYNKDETLNDLEVLLLKKKL